MVANRQVGLCLLCHSGPFPEERFQGNLAPDLKERRAALRRRDPRAHRRSAARSNPRQHHAGLFRAPSGLTRVAPSLQGKTILSGGTNRGYRCLLADAEMNDE